MARTRLFLVIILAAVAGTLSFAGTLLPHQLMMSGAQRMMGGEGAGTMFWPSLLTGSVALLVVVVGYLIAFPAIRYSQPQEGIQNLVTQAGPVKGSEPEADLLGIVMRVLKPDERAALQVLRNSGEVCMQKDITYNAGLSKLKTHRVVARLAERGVIQVRKVGKTNEITVPEWLKSPNAKAGD